MHKRILFNSAAVHNLAEIGRKALHCNLAAIFFKNLIITAHVSAELGGCAYIPALYFYIGIV